MRIAFDHQIFCRQIFGGVSRYFTRLASKLVISGEAIRVFAPVYCNQYLKELNRGVVNGFYFERSPFAASSIGTGFNHYLSRIQIRSWQPQIIHETYYSPKTIGTRGSAVFLTVYDMIHEKFPSEFSANDPTSRFKLTATKRADHVICISESTRNDLLELFSLPEEKVSVVHLGYEPLGGAALPLSDTALDTKPYLLYVGARRGYKNFFRFLESISISRLLSGFDVVAFGGGVFAADESRRIAELGFRPGQVRHKCGNDHALGRCYSGAAAFVYPSLYEGFGLPPLEAMAFGCPVVSSNTSSMPEVIGDAGEFFNPTSLDDMRSAIERVVFYPTQRAVLRQRGAARLQRFSWEACAARTLESYRRLT